MKFFKNLPKTTFESTIGTFNISDFFTYLDVETAPIEEASITIDDKTTLLEAAYRTYNDANSFWAFVAASNTINPFDLLAPNSAIFSKNVEGKLNFVLSTSASSITGGVAFPAGTILTPYTSNTGACYYYGSTGNFNLSGPFAVIEQTSYYDGNMVLGNQVGGTGNFIVVGNPSEQVTVLQKTTGGTYSWAGSYYVANKKYVVNKVVSQVINKDAKSISREVVSSNPTIDDILPVSTPIGGSTAPTNYTALQQVDSKSKNVQAYVPNELGLIQSSFVTTKYN
jgi:hypothetical protein